jgi:hypothetical protein
MRRRAILEMMRGKTNQSHHFFPNFALFNRYFSSIGDNSRQRVAITLHKVLKKRLSAQILPAVSMLFLAPLAACEPAIDAEPVAAPTELTDSGCGENGALQTALFGSLETSVSWTGSEMQCENMLRPDNKGIRLRFAGDIEGERLALIIAIPGLTRGETAGEIPSNVTTTVEGSGRFFSTPSLESCWTDVRSQTPVSDAENTFVLSATLYCVAPLGEINGDAAVYIPELTFTTLVHWSKT